MTTKLLMMILGASCASAWWAFATIIPGDTPFPVVPIFLTIGVIAVIVMESVKTNLG
jgi:hypothetical protein